MLLMEWSYLSKHYMLLYAQDKCHLFRSLSNLEFKVSDDMANG